MAVPGTLIWAFVNSVNERKNSDITKNTSLLKSEDIHRFLEKEKALTVEVKALFLSFYMPQGISGFALFKGQKGWISISPRRDPCFPFQPFRERILLPPLPSAG